MAKYSKNSSQVALITGSARRIGSTLAQRLHHEGFNVVIHYRHSEKEALTLSETLNSKRPQSALALQADLSFIGTLEDLVQSTISAFGRLDVLINNASEYFPTPIGQACQDDWQRLFSSNAFAPFFLTQAANPYLKQVSGSVINMIDVNANQALANYPIYCAAKAALKMLTHSLALELSPTVRVNGISPGNTLPAEGPNQLDAQEQQQLLNNTLLKRRVDPDDIAHTVLFLIRNNSITGQIINIDAGRCLSTP